MKQSAVLAFVGSPFWDPPHGGDDGPASDLDFVVDFEKKSFDAYMDLKAFLEKLFGCRVDPVVSDAIKPRLRSIIMSEAVYAPGL